MSRYLQEGGTVLSELSGLNITVRVIHRSTEWAGRSVHATSKSMSAGDADRIDNSEGVQLIRQLYPFELEYATFLAVIKHPKMLRLVSHLHDKELRLPLIDQWAKAPNAKSVTALKRALHSPDTGGAAEGNSERGATDEEKEGGPSTPPSMEQDSQDLLANESDEEVQFMSKKRRAALGLTAASTKKQKK